MVPRRSVILSGAGLLVGASSLAATPPIGLRTDLGVWTDDFDGLLKRRVIRMLVPYGRTLFFEDRGTLYGVTVNGAQALSGTNIAVQDGTSFQQSLAALNAKLSAAGKPPVKITTVPGTLEVEDIMEMVAAGLLPATVVDDWLARIWQPLIPKLELQDKAVLRSGTDIAWAVRPNNPKLLATLNEAITQVGGSVEQISRRTAIYVRSLKQIHDATGGGDVKRFEALQALFVKYGDSYDFDELLLQAQSYQESRLQQSARSHVGAIGLMQLMPTTGTAMKVGDIHQADANVHAGAKYMRQLVDRYFPDAHFDRQNRTLFAFASYNAGPGAIARMRELAAQQGLNPDVWFDNVERVTAAHIGQQPVRYVRNIYKYYVAYSLLEEQQNEVEKAKKAAAAGG